MEATIHPGIDRVLTSRVDHLLRTDPRLVGAASLIGRIAVLPVPEPKPKAEKKAPGRTKKKRPERPGRPIRDEPPEVEAPPEDGPAAPPPEAWKVVRASKISDRLRAVFGDLYAVVLVVAPSWHLLGAEERTAALVCALRPIRVEVVEADSGDIVERLHLDKPPIQVWPDTADDYASVLAALAPAGAAPTVAVAESYRASPTTTTTTVVLRPAVFRELRAFSTKAPDGRPYEHDEPVPSVFNDDGTDLGDDD